MMSARLWIAVTAAMAASQAGAGVADPTATPTSGKLRTAREQQCSDLLASPSPTGAAPSKAADPTHPATPPPSDASGAVAAMPADPAPQDPLSASDSSNATQVKLAIANTICNVRLLRNTYQGWTEEKMKDGKTIRVTHPGKIQIKRNLQSSFDSSLIGLGIASVATAFYGASKSTIGGVALAAAGLQQYRSYYNPDGEGLTYVIAAKATRCIASNAEPLLSDSPATLWKAIKSLNIAIDAVQTSSAQLQATNETGSSASKSQPAASAQAEATQQKMQGSTAAADALTAANTAMIAALAEARAYNDAPAAIDEAHDAIKDYVDRQLHRTGVSYSDVQTALTNAINSASTVESNVQQAQTQLMTAVKSNATAGANSGGVSSGIAPSPGAVDCLADAGSTEVLPASGAGASSACATSAPASNPSPGATTPLVATNPPAATNPPVASAQATSGHAASALSRKTTAPATVTVTMAAQDNSRFVANLIAATTNVVNLISAHRYTTINNQVSVVCVTGLGS